MHDAMSLPDWLRRFALLVAGDLDINDARERLRIYGESLQADFAPSVFTAESARHVARTANPKGFFPRYPEVCAALTAWAKDNPVGPKRLPGGAPEGPSRPGAGHWHGFIAGRLVAGGDRANLLSLARQYAPPAEVRSIMAAFYPDELRAEERHAAEVRRDKAQAAAQVVKAAAAALKPAKAPKPAAAPAEPAPAAMDPHWPLPKPTLREMRDNLVRLEREAATADPPPNAAQRIARLRERIEQERAA
jgi:hypothetical protein